MRGLDSARTRVMCERAGRGSFATLDARDSKKKILDDIERRVIDSIDNCSLAVRDGCEFASRDDCSVTARDGYKLAADMAAR